LQEAKVQVVSIFNGKNYHLFVYYFLTILLSSYVNGLGRVNASGAIINLGSAYRNFLDY